jgi:hypothetical protein
MRHRPFPAALDPLRQVLVATSLCLCAISAPAQVAYDGAALVVGAKRYAAVPSGDQYQPAVVLAVARDGLADALAERLRSLGLASERGGPPVVMFIVRVPAGFETQWVSALRDFPEVLASDLSKLFRTSHAPSPNLSIDTDPQQQAAASPLVLVVWSSSR